ncbi:MAG: cell division protein FtsK/SpoIIIE [Nocardioidaceae bacterium]|nr:cell division protein FtsK/SpoIIIE [Nocardioidaceae bacterium]
MSDVLEWWPDYDGQVLFLRRGRGGHPVDPATLGLSEAVLDDLQRWSSVYAEENLPIGGPGDPCWLDEGIGLLHRVRAELAGRYEVVVTEPWWGERPAN